MFRIKERLGSGYDIHHAIRGPCNLLFQALVESTSTLRSAVSSAPVTSKGIEDGQAGVPPPIYPSEVLGHGDECVTETVFDVEIIGWSPVTKLSDVVSSSLGFAVVSLSLVEL